MMSIHGFAPEEYLEDVLGNKEYLVDDGNGAVSPVTLDYRKNRRNWISNDLSLKIFNNVAHALGDTRSLHDVGKAIFESKVSGSYGWALRFAALSPRILLSVSTSTSVRINKTKKFEILDFDKNRGMLARITYTDESATKSPLACQYNEGGIVGLCSLWATDIKSRKVSCACSGIPAVNTKSHGRNDRSSRLWLAY